VVALTHSDSSAHRLDAVVRGMADVASAPVFDGTDYELTWPAAVSADELREILKQQTGPDWRTRAAALSAEAFVGD
jgi:uncharacterized protein YbjT (DUF2867 family)